MGHYVRLKTKFKLKKDVPKDVFIFFKNILIEGYSLCYNFENEHAFFKCDRWHNLLTSTNTEDIHGGEMYEENDYWVIDLHTEFKNYDDEIDKFIDWVSPFVLGRKKKEYIGFWKYEDSNRQNNIYIERV